MIILDLRGGFSGKQKLRPAILEDEDLAKTGMGAVLNMARRKGFLDQEEEGRKDMGLKDLICKDYKIDDKSRQVAKLYILGSHLSSGPNFQERSRGGRQEKRAGQRPWFLWPDKLIL